MKKKGIKIVPIILLVIVIVVLWFLGSIFAWFGPKDLGVKYTEKDLKSAIEKIGMNASFDGKIGTEINGYIKSLGKQGIERSDYNWSYSDFQAKTITLTPAEATAFLNDIAPAFNWFSDVQVNVNDSGKLEASGTVNVGKLKADLYSDVASKIPVPIPDKVNMSGAAKMSITDNKLNASESNINIGMVPLPAKYITGENGAIVSKYLERIYTVIPGFKINSLKADKNKNIVVDAVVPQNISITKK